MLGFSPDDCQEALEWNDNNVEEAAIWLTQNAYPADHQQVQIKIKINNDQFHSNCGWYSFQFYANLVWFEFITKLTVSFIVIIIISISFWTELGYQRIEDPMRGNPDRLRQSVCHRWLQGRWRASAGTVSVQSPVTADDRALPQDRRGQHHLPVHRRVLQSHALWYSSCKSCKNLSKLILNWFLYRVGTSHWTLQVSPPLGLPSVSGLWSWTNTSLHLLRHGRYRQRQLHPGLPPTLPCGQRQLDGRLLQPNGKNGRLCRCFRKDDLPAPVTLRSVRTAQRHRKPTEISNENGQFVVGFKSTFRSD